MKYRNVKNRRFARILVGAVAGLGMSLAVFGEQARADDASTLTVVSYGGVYQEAQAKAYFEPYQKEHPEVTIRQESPTSNAKLKAMVDAGSVTWDIALVDDSFGLDADAAWLEPIDYSIINKDDYLPGYATKYRLGADVEATAITYRKDKIQGAAPNTFADFFDTKKFPGKRAIWKYSSGGVMEAALLADGVAPDHLYPLDIERALKKLDTIKSDIIWWETGAQSEQLITSGEATMGLLWLSRSIETAKNAPTAIGWGQWTTQNGFWVVPKGTKNKDSAMRALKSFTSPASQTEFSKLMPFGGTNKNATVPSDTQFKGNLPTEHLDGRVVIDVTWWNANEAAVDAKFQDWLLQ